MQTQIQTQPGTQTKTTTENENSDLVAHIARRLARIPHVIRLPADPPPPPELLRLIEARIAELEAQQPTLNLRDGDQALEFAANKSILSILKMFQDELRAANPPALCVTNYVPASSTSLISEPSLTNKFFVEKRETNETNPQHQQLPVETELRLSESDSLPTESDPPPSKPASLSLQSNPSLNDADAEKQFAAQLQEIPEQYHEIAADLYEQLHHRTKFSDLTSDQRRALFELCKQHPEDRVLKVIAEPPPIGMNFKTSRASLFRFCSDYKRILFDEEKIEAEKRARQEKLAFEAAFQAANASDETFRQSAERLVRKRLFNVARDPASHPQEIRWLLKSLELLRKEAPKPVSPNNTSSYPLRPDIAAKP